MLVTPAHACLYMTVCAAPNDRRDGRLKQDPEVSSRQQAAARSSGVQNVDAFPPWLLGAARAPSNHISNQQNGAALSDSRPHQDATTVSTQRSSEVVQSVPSVVRGFAPHGVQVQGTSTNTVSATASAQRSSEVVLSVPSVVRGFAPQGTQGQETLAQGAQGQGTSITASASMVYAKRGLGCGADSETAAQTLD